MTGNERVILGVILLDECAVKGTILMIHFGHNEKAVHIRFPKGFNPSPYFLHVIKISSAFSDILRRRRLSNR